MRRSKLAEKARLYEQLATRGVDTADTDEASSLYLVDFEQKAVDGYRSGSAASASARPASTASAAPRAQPAPVASPPASRVEPEDSDERVESVPAAPAMPNPHYQDVFNEGMRAFVLVFHYSIHLLFYIYLRGFEYSFDCLSYLYIIRAFIVLCGV